MSPFCVPPCGLSPTPPASLVAVGLFAFCPWDGLWRTGLAPVWPPQAEPSAGRASAGLAGHQVGDGTAWRVLSPSRVLLTVVLLREHPICG